MAKRIFASSPWHLTVDKDLGHRHLNVGQLPTLISHRMWYASARIRAWGSRGAQVHVLARHFQNTFAHTPAALCMPHSMCDMPQHRPDLLAQCVMHRADSCVDEAHYIEAHDAWNEAMNSEVGSRRNNALG